jgi:hypothetical protein
MAKRRGAPKPVIDFGAAAAELDDDPLNFVHGAASEAGLLNVEPNAILSRTQSDLFSASIRHALAIAESVWVTERILTPVLLDSKRRLVDGKHRVLATRLLRETPEHRPALLRELKDDGLKHVDAEAEQRALALEHRPALLVPVLRLDFDSSVQGSSARIAEIVSNAIHDRRSREFRKVLQVVQADDRFSMARGRPKKGTLSGRQFLARIFGVDVRTISEWTAQERGETYRKPASPERAAHRAVQLAQKSNDPAAALGELLLKAADSLSALQDPRVDAKLLAQCLQMLRPLTTNGDH